MTDDHNPPVTSTPVGLIGVSDKDAFGYDHKAEALARVIYDTDPWFDNGARLLTFDEAEPRGLIRNSALAASAILARFNVTERDTNTRTFMENGVGYVIRESGGAYRWVWIEIGDTEDVSEPFKTEQEAIRAAWDDWCRNGGAIRFDWRDALQNAAVGGIR